MLIEELLSITSFQVKVSIFTKTLKSSLWNSTNASGFSKSTCVCKSYMSQKHTLRICTEHLVCINLLNLYILKYSPLSHHHQSRHNRLVENPSLCYKLFQKFHPSIQLHTPTDPPICLVPHVLQVHHHERSFHLLHHHSHPQDHFPFAVTSRNLHMAPTNSYH